MEEVGRADWFVAIVQALRPRQWVKNALVFAAPMAAGVLFEQDTWWRVLAMFALFSAAASAVYLINDILDRSSDRIHPRKRHRPIASGRLGVKVALSLAVVLATLSLSLSFAIAPQAAALVATYLVVSMTYSVVAKHVAVLDLLMVSSGFVIRAAAGAAVTSVPISRWFLTVMAFGALAMAAGKRSSELRSSPADSGNARRVLTSYNMGFLIQVETIAVGGALVSYALWAFDMAAEWTNPVLVELSVVPFATALLRYLLSISRGDAEAPEEAIFSDRLIAISGLAWVCMLGAGIGVGI